MRRVRLTVLVCGYAEPVYSIALEIELDQHGGLVTNHPSMMPGFDSDELGRFVFEDTSVRKSNIDLAPGHEADVCVHTQIRSDHGF